MTNQDRCQKLLDQIKSRQLADYEHACRVQKIVEILASFDARIDADSKAILSIAAALHDVGTLSISADIVTHSGRLSFEQYEEIQAHPSLAETYLTDFDNGAEIARLIRHHHENINGFGYPDGLKGDQIPLGSRMIHVAEALDSMVCRRNQMSGLSTHLKGALAELQKYSGRMYDASIVGLVANHLDDIQTIYDKLHH